MPQEREPAGGTQKPGWKRQPAAEKAPPYAALHKTFVGHKKSPERVFHLFGNCKARDYVKGEEPVSSW